MTIISYSLYAQPSSKHNLQSDHLASRWDEAIPLGNGMLGALIWQKDNTLRLSLDRADLWDERQAFKLQQHDFKWVQQKLDGGQYAEVQKWGTILMVTTLIQPNFLLQPCLLISLH